MSLGLHTIASTMNTRSSTAKRLRETSQKSQEKYKAFNVLSTNFSKEELAKLGDSQKNTYIYMKKKYDTMISLGDSACCDSYQQGTILLYHLLSDEGPQEASNVQQREHVKEMRMKAAREENDTKPLPLTPGSESAQKELCPPGKASASGQESEKMSGPSKLKSSVCDHNLREWKNQVLYEEISGPEEDD
ncbi:putative protein SSX6 [Hipposideros larvatus]